jgi:hypothetical protein
MCGPAQGQNFYLKDNEIHNLRGGLPALHHHAFISYTGAVLEKILENWSICFTFCPIQKAPEEKKS